MLQPADLLVLGAYVAWSVSSGLASRAIASRDLEEYFLAGRSLSGRSAGISMAATQFAADTPLVVTGLVATGGLLALWRPWIYAIAFLLLAFGVAAVAAASLSTSATLVGLGGWIAGAPGAAWIGSPAAWRALLVGIADAALPIAVASARRAAPAPDPDRPVPERIP